MAKLAVSALGMMFLLVAAGPSVAQEVPLYLADERTRIQSIDFDFVSTKTFEADQLEQQILSAEPGFFERIKKYLPFLSVTYPPLDRIELQKDVVRLRRFYRQNGFLSPWIEYGDSRLDTTDNRIDVVFTVEEGPPLIIQDVNFFAPDSSYATSLFDGDERERWIRFRDRTSFKTGDRYTDFDLARIQDQVLNWFKDRGYAFARFDGTEVVIDSTFNTADIRFFVRPGPRARFDEIIVEGDATVDRRIVLRELPFQTGERFSYSKLIEGQRELFSLNLFRLALADVPEEQPIDSTVAVRFRLRQAKLRYLTAQAGFLDRSGVTLQGQWTHRNFFGGARNLTVSALAETGVLAQSGAATEQVPLLFRASVALRQPYLFTTRLSGTIEPFVEAERSKLLGESEARLGINRRALGVNTTLIYEALPFRPISLSYRVAQVLQPKTAAVAGIQLDRDSYSESVLTLNGTFGRVNDFFRPRRGFLVRPLLQQAGSLGGLLRAGVTYSKASVEVVGYLPLLRRVSLAARVAGGRLWPRGASTAQFEVPFENRFDPIRFYSGGSEDVRGWNLNFVGPKENLTAFVRDSTNAIVFNDDGVPRTKNEEYQPVGGLAKLSGNVEVRMPFPGLSEQWRTAVFLDFGQVSAEHDPGQVCPPEPSGGRQCGFLDEGRLALDSFRFGAGGGFRYETPIGFIRFDVGIKLNPDDLDLQKPRDAFLFEQGFLEEPKKSFLSRINIHVNIGQAF